MKRNRTRTMLVAMTAVAMLVAQQTTLSAAGYAMLDGVEEAAATTSGAQIDAQASAQPQATTKTDYSQTSHQEPDQAAREALDRVATVDPMDEIRGGQGYDMLTTLLLQDPFAEYVKHVQTTVTQETVSQVCEDGSCATTATATTTTSGRRGLIRGLFRGRQRLIQWRPLQRIRSGGSCASGSCG